jgi:hypothetical protein
MTKLMQAIAENPEAVFEIEANLPSGNRMSGTAGPMIGAKICVHMNFAKSPASADDIAIARRVLDQLFESEAAFIAVSNTADEHSQAVKEMRAFMGGGEG